MSNVDSGSPAVDQSGSVAVKTPPDLSKYLQEEEGLHHTKANNSSSGSVSRRLKKGRVAELSSRFDCQPDRIVVRVRRNRIEEVKVCRAPSTARSFRNGSKMSSDSFKVCGDAKRKPSFRRTPGKVKEAVRKLENFRLQNTSVQEKVVSKQSEKIQQVKQDDKPVLNKVKEVENKTCKYGKLYEKLRLKPTSKIIKKPMTLPKPDIKTLENNGKAPFLNEPAVQKILQSRSINNIKKSNDIKVDNENKTNVLNIEEKTSKESSTLLKKEEKQSPKVPPRPFMDDSKNCANDSQDKENKFKDLNTQSITNIAKTEISEDERLYEEMKLRMKPNQSFLFRSISKTEPSDIYMNVMEIEEQSVNESVNNSDSENKRCDIYPKPKPSSTKSDSLNNSIMSVNTSNLSLNNSKNSSETLNKYEGVILRRDLASRNVVDNEYAECEDITIVNNMKNGSVYSERHLYQRLSDCSSKLYDHLSYEEHNYEVCNEPLPPRNGLSTSIRHSNSSQSSDEIVCSLYETIPATTIDCEGNFPYS